MSQPNRLVFTVHRREPELIRPAEPTPHEFKKLSDIDDQEGLRSQIPNINFYRGGESSIHEKGRDPVQVIRESLARALVFYYPFAGRVREWSGGKLVVECNEEGVVFIEADADVCVDQFGDPIQLPIPCIEDLLYDVPGSSGILDCPLLLIQVTRFKCGGFTFALRLNHTICGAAGLTQFMNAIGDIARGANAPSILPVWKRELLDARNPPRITCIHREYDEIIPTTKGTSSSTSSSDDIARRSFFFGPAELASLRRLAPPHPRNNYSTFELLTACLWRCRTMAIQPNPEEEVRAMIIVNATSKFNPPLPEGYYGNVVAYPVAITTAGKLCQSPLGFAMELLRKAKSEVTEEYIRSVADLMVIRGRPPFTLEISYLVSDLTRSGLRDVDFGWGKAVYGGVAKARVSSFYVPYKNRMGEEGIVVPICLPSAAMERFVQELDRMIKGQVDPNKKTSILSRL